MGVKCSFVENYRNDTAAVEAMADGDCILLENLRVNEGEKKNDKKFAKELASLADLYIDDAFAVAHRAHASIVAITEFLPSYMGFLLEDEVKHLSAAFHPKRPFLFILCGAKFETKLPLIEKFMGIADHVFVGGALANNFFKEKGMEIGQSLISAQNFDLKRFYDDPIFSKKLLLPVDVVVLCKDGKKVIKKPEAVAADENIVDAGPDTVAMLGTKINAAAEILWNGPLGAYENGFKEPTLALAHLIADRTLAGAESIVGGGDTLATIADMQKPANGDPTESQFTFISTGGGAMLDYLANESLPGLDALENSKT
jgi:phosphoglycerate kinase